MRRQYTDAEKADYWRRKALAKGSPKTTLSKSYTPKKGKHYYAYKTYQSKAAREDAAARREATKEPGILSAGGTALGAALTGHPIGAFLGGKIGHLVEKITGFGDYKVEYNTLLKGGMSPPQVVNSVSTGGFIVRHREYITDIPATTGFFVQSFLIQPGLPSSFPWLSQIANSFDQYRLRGMLYEFKSTSSDALLSASTSTALGSVTMSTDYDVADPVPGDKATLLNNEFASSDKPSCSFIHPIECKKSRSALGLFFTRGVLAVPTGFDQRLFDFARFNIATVGMQANGGILGELWVTYEIEFFKQQIAPDNTLFDHFFLTGTFAAGTPFGTVQSRTAGSNLGGSISTTNYNFPPQLASGTYSITWYINGDPNVVTGIDPGTLSFTNCNGKPILLNNTASGVVSPTPAGNIQSESVQFELIVTVLATGAFITLTGLVPPSGTVEGDLFVTRISDHVD